MPNRLIGETSPYLLQHAHNPVDWYPWGDEALARATSEDRPILLSIGYAACHWCHVMERESFEDAATAALMNERFVCIKVDREERPDLDSVYMSAVQAMTGHGGWPMTMFLTPAGKPFYGGTYFPPEPRHGMPAFSQILDAVHDAWLNKRDELEAQSAQLVEHIARAATLSPSDDALREQLLNASARAMIEQLDPEWGGFGTGMKFPQASNLEFLLRMHARDYPGALEDLCLTLDHMARGGIFDHLGGGFHRYAVDRVWLVPHFEKMLYDNGQLLRLYARAWQVTGSALYRETAEATADWMLREMQHPDGGFFSSLDADSEGVEGKFYVWSYEELIALAGDDMPLAIAAFAASGTGNWDGTNVLARPMTDEELSGQTDVGVEQVRAAIDRVKKTLFDARAHRLRPATDDKVLAAWNGMAIAGLAEAGRVFARADFVDAAARAADFVLTQMRSPAGRLLRSWRDGARGGPGFLEDHALMADACLALYETTFDTRWYAEAMALARAMLELFVDTERGGFYDTGSDVASPVVRPKDIVDGATPSGNAVASDVLLRLAALSGDEDLARAGEGFIRIVARAMAESPLGFGAALGVADRMLAGTKEIAVVGDPAAEDARALLAVPLGRYMPNRVVAAGPAGTREPPLLRDRLQRDNRATAYVCQNFACRMPVTDPEALAAQLFT